MMGAVLLGVIMAAAFGLDALDRRSLTCGAGCGNPWTCEHCRRCDNRRCNAGCINCRPREDWDPVSRGINRLGRRLFGLAK